MRKGTVSLALAAMVMASAAAAQQPPAPLTLEAVFGSPAISGPTPRALQLSPDGRYATLLKPRAEDRERFDLWAIDIASGEERMLVDSLKLGSGAELSEEEKMRRERARIAGTKGIVSYQWGPDGKQILVPIDGDLWVAPLTGTPRRLTDTKGTELDARLSPGGRFVSFVRDGDLHVTEIASGRETRLTTDASETLRWGVAEFVAQEELDRSDGHWWSPDESLLAVARVDESGVMVVERAAIGAEGTRVYSQRYPRAGTPNARVDLFIMRPDGSGRVQVDLGADPDIYLARATWARDGRTLYVQRLTRDQKRLDVLAIDPRTGKGPVILSETARTFVNLASDGFGQGGQGGLRPLADGSFLWLSERDGFMHLYRFAGGKLSQLTRGPWVVSAYAGVDEKAGRAFVLGNRDGVLERHIYAVPLSGNGEPQRLTEPGYWNSGGFDPSGRAMIVSRSSPTQPPQTYLADASGKRTRWIIENRVTTPHPLAAHAALLTEPEFGTIPAADGTPLHWRLLKPAGPGPHPVFVQVYGGPHVQRVSREWVPPVERWLVQQGWAVFKLDNRGSYNRGKAFEDPIHLAMGGVEVTDQLAAATWLKRQPWADPERLVVQGWSYGGYMVLKLLAAAPGTFAAGVSGAPVTQWDLYDTAYTERYLGDPRTVPQVYRKADVLPEAAKIADPLLLIHGMADDNVIFENTTRLVAILQRAKRPFELMVYPGQTHAIAGPELNVHHWQTVDRFLRREAGIGGGAAPAAPAAK